MRLRRAFVQKEAEHCFGEERWRSDVGEVLLTG
jgi:hypothetical protein